MGYFSEKNLLEMDPNSSPQDIKEGLKVTGVGKGDGRRPREISSQQMAENWCRTFGHKRWSMSKDKCLDCGLTGEQFRDQQELDPRDIDTDF